MNVTSLRTIRAGREDLAAGHHVPRHRHLHAYAILLVDGEFDQVSYAGRIRVRPGELIVQPTLDAHANRMPGGKGARIVRLPWHDVDDLGGVYPVRDVDAIVRAAERDAHAAWQLARGSRGAPRRPANDLPDALAAALAGGAVPQLAAWAAGRARARETVAREFTQAFGIPARQFRAELRTRAAWLQVVRTSDSLAAIAAATGFADQAHMTRAIRALTGQPPAAWRRDPRTSRYLRA